MKLVLNPKRTMTSIVVLGALMTRLASPAFAASSVRLTELRGAIDLSADGAMPFVLEGNASNLGPFRAHGEIEFVRLDGGILIGHGVAVFEDANGDLLVGTVTSAMLGATDGLAAAYFHFSWSNSVTFSDGTIVSNTGHYIKNRPLGLVVITIIDILIGLILPSIQT